MSFLELRALQCQIWPCSLHLPRPPNLYLKHPPSAPKHSYSQPTQMAHQLSVTFSPFKRLPVIIPLTFSREMHWQLEGSSRGRYMGICPVRPEWEGFRTNCTQRERKMGSKSLILTNYIFKDPFFQIKSHSEVLEVNTSTYLLGGHNSTHKRCLIMTSN